MGSRMNTQEMVIIQIALKTEIKEIKPAVLQAVGEKGYIEFNVANEDFTWVQLFLNNNIEMKNNYLIKNDSMGHITSKLSDSIASYVNQFQKKKKRYNARIIKRTVERQSSPVKKNVIVLGGKPKQGMPVVVSPKRGRGRPQGSPNKNKNLSASQRLVKKPSKSKVLSFPNGIAGFLDGPFIGNGLDNSPHHNNIEQNYFRETQDNFDSQSQLSFCAFPSVMENLGYDTSTDVKSALIETIVKSVNNAMLYNIKKEYEELKQKGKWLRVAAHVPHLGNLVSVLFSDEHFKKLNS